LGEVAKLHHTVPQFYLRGFASDAARITTAGHQEDCGDEPLFG
jgi:hypothetical protein